MFTLPELPFSSSALEPYIDQQTMEVHHGKHHAAYVKNLNDALAQFPDLSAQPIEQLLSNLEQIPEAVRTKVVNNGGGHLNHTLFWQWLSPKSSPPTGPLLEAINSTFGNLDTFKEKFTALSVGHFGSGWGWLVSQHGKLSLMDTANQDSPVSVGLTPVLSVDVWEHAYYLKYQNRRADYLSAWWNVVNWTKVSEDFSASLK